MIKETLKKISGRINPLRKENTEIEIFPDDIFIVGFPKSGNTWVRFLIGNYITDCKCDFTNSYKVIPDIHFAKNKCAEIQSKPRFIHSHNPYTPTYPKVIYIIRDGRDVAVSYFFYLKKLGTLAQETPFSVFLKDFVEKGAHEYGTWSEHVDSWMNRSNVMTVKYEELLADPATQLEKILNFAGMEIDRGRLNRAVEASSFKSMQEMEVKQHDECPTLKDVKNKEIRFVRDGRAGGWRAHFSKTDEEFFVNTQGKMLKKLGYL